MSGVEEARSWTVPGRVSLARIPPCGRQFARPPLLYEDTHETQHTIHVSYLMRAYSDVRTSFQGTAMWHRSKDEEAFALEVGRSIVLELSKD